MIFNRDKRVAELIRREVSEMLASEIKDPRIGFVTVTGVEMTQDVRYGKIFVSIYGTEEDKKRTMTALESAERFIRREIGRRIRLRFTPELHFKYDASIEYAAHIDEVLRKLKEGGKVSKSKNEKRIRNIRKNCQRDKIRQKNSHNISHKP